MIIESILNLFLGFIKFVFGWLNLPQFPESLTNVVDTFLDLIFNNVSLLGFFIRPDTIKIVLPVLIIIINFEKLYKFVMWILRKIPILGIE